MATIIERIRQQEAELVRLKGEAKDEAYKAAQDAVDTLNALGFGRYELREVGGGRKPATNGGRKGTRQVAPDRPCPVCGFKTEPPHDGRRHKGQEPKRPFTSDELAKMGMHRL